jgi:kelch-like protein 10
LPPKELQAVIGADELNVRGEDVVWEGVLHWINHDVENIKCHLLEFMEKVRLGLLDRHFWELVLFF